MRAPAAEGSSAGARPVSVASRNSASSRSAASGRNLCLSLVAQRGDARRVEPRRLADLDLLLRKVERPVEQLDDVLGDRQPLGGARGVGIGARRIGHDRDADRVGIRLGRRDVAATRLDAAADAAEQVDLVGDVETGIEAGGRVRLRPGSRPRVAAGADAALRQTVDLHLAERGACRGEAGDRGPDVGVVRERVGDQPVEHRVVVEPPPVARDRRERLERW